MPKVKDRLYLRFRTPEGTQSAYSPAVYDSKSRLRAGWCLVHGTAEHHPDATYYQRLKRNGNWFWQALGTDPATAWAKSGATTLRQVLVPDTHPEPEKPKGADGCRLDDEVKVYLSNAAKLADATYKAYKRSLELFQQSCERTYVHQITKQDLQAFDTMLMELGNGDRTRHNRVGHIVTFLRNKEGRRLGPEIKDVSIKVKYVEAPPEAYTRRGLEDLFRVSDEDDKFLWRFFLGSGFRESEACTLTRTGRTWSGMPRQPAPRSATATG